MTFGEVTVQVMVASGMVIVILLTTGSLTAGAADIQRVKPNARTKANLEFMAICGQTQGNVCPKRYEEK